MSKKLRSLISGGKRGSERDVRHDSHRDPSPGRDHPNNLVEIGLSSLRNAPSMVLSPSFRSIALPDPSDPIRKELTDLWDKYRTALQHPEGESINEIVRRMLYSLNPHFDKWNPELEIERMFSSRRTKAVLAFPPLDVFVAKHMASTLSSYAQTWTHLPDDVEACTISEGLAHVYFVNVLSRSTFNVPILLFSDVLATSVGLAKWTFARLQKRFVNIKPNRNMTVTAEREEVFLQVLATYLFQIICNFTNFQSSWRRYFEGSDEERLELEAEEINYRQAKKEALQLGVLTLIQDSLVFVDSIVVKEGLSGSQVGFEMLLLCAVGGILFFNPSAQTYIRDSGLLDVLVQRIGWAELANPAELQQEFKLQFLCLQCVCLAVERNTENVQKIAQVKGWEKITEFIFWTTENFSINPFFRIQSEIRDVGERLPAMFTSAQLLPTASVLRPAPTDGADAEFVDYLCQHMSDKKDQPLPPPPPIDREECFELSTLFQMLFVMCVGYTRFSPNEVSGSALFSFHSPFAAGKINRTVVNVVLDLFNPDFAVDGHCNRVRERCKLEFPELQLFALEFITKLVMHHESAIDFCNSLCMLDTLFSKYFFDLPLATSGIGPTTPSTTTLPGGSPPGPTTLLDSRSPQAPPSPGPQNTSGATDYCLIISRRRHKAHQQYLFNAVKSQVLMFVAFIATVQGRSNIDEFRKMLELLEKQPDNIDLVYSICQTMVKILNYNLTQTQKSFHLLNGLPVIALIIDLQQTISHLSINASSAAERDGACVVLPYSSELFYKARYATLSVLTNLLEKNDDMVRYALRDFRTVNTLFNLLFEPGMRKFALTQIVSLMKMGKVAAEDEVDIHAKLYRQYLSYVNKLQNGSLMSHHELVIALLEGIRLVVNSNPKTQKYFREADAFLTLVNILNGEERRDRLPELCKEVLKTLTVLVANNSKNKTYFRTDIGYDQLRSLIERCLAADDQRKLKPVLIDLLFEMLVESTADNDVQPQLAIQNADIIPLMFNLFPSMTTEQRQSLVSRFIPLVEKCTLNQSLCCSRHLIFILLGIVPQIRGQTSLLIQVLSLVEILGAYSIEVRELKRLFLLLKSEPGDFRPLAHTLLLKTLHFMALSRELGPQVFFDFDGKCSGLSLPSLEKFPPTHGFTFCTWVRVESFFDPAGRPKFEPRLLSFLNDEGHGIEAYFSETFGRVQLIYEIVAPGGKRYMAEMGDYDFKEKTWFFFAITHNNSTLFTQSELKIYINGKIRQKSNLKYIQFPQLNLCRIGSNSEVQSASRKLYRETPFYGQMGTIYFLDEALTASQVKSMFELGPNDIASFQATETGSTTLDSTITPKIFLHYNCKAQRGTLFLDNTPEKNRDRTLDAKRLGNLNSCVTRDVRDMIHCIGGIKALLPLFAQLNQPPIPNSPDEPIDYSIDPKLLVQITALLGDMLNDSPTNEHEMLRCQGFAIVGFLLQQCSPLHLTMEFLVTLQDLTNKLEVKGLLDDLYINVLFDMRLWIFTPFEVQKELLNVYLELIKSKKEFCRRVIGIQKFFDILRFFYWYEPVGIGVTGHGPVYHPITKECIGKRPTIEQLKKLRGMLFLAIKYLISDGPTSEEMEVFISSICDCSDLSQMMELLTFILQLLNPTVSLTASTSSISSSSSSSSSSGFLDLLISCGGVDPFLFVMRNDNEMVRILCLKVIGTMMKQAGTSDKKRKLTRSSNEFTPTTHILVTYPYSEAVHQVLFQILVDRISVPEAISDPSVSARIEVDAELRIKNPNVLPVILKLLLVGDIHLRQKALQDLYLLLNRSADNKAKVLCLFGWQHLLFALMADRPEAKFADDAAVVNNTIISIFTVLLSHSMQYDKRGYKVLEATIGFLMLYDARGVLSRRPVSRTLFMSLVSALQNEIATKDKDLFAPKSTLISNLLYFFILVEEFVYYASTYDTITPSQERFASTTLSESFLSMSLRRVGGPEGEWEDFGLVRSLLDILDAVKFFSNPSLFGVDTSATKKPRLRGGFSRVSLRFCLTMIQEGDVKVCVENVPRIRAIINKDLVSSSGKKDEGPSPRLTYVISHLLKTLRTTKTKEISKAIVPLIKDIIRTCKPILPPTTQQLQNLAEQGRIKEFLEAMNNTTELSALRETVDNLAKTIDNEEKSFCASISKQRTKHLRRVQSGLEKESTTELVDERKMTGEYLYYQNKFAYAEIARKTREARLRDENKDAIARSWLRILRSLTNERGPWGNKETQVYWKEDKTENFSRMRIKLKRNYAFDPHKGAAIDCSVEEKRTSQDDTPETRNAPIKISGIKLADISQVSEDRADRVDDEDVETTATPNEPMDPSSADDGKRIYTTYCELVTPMRVTPGRLEITSMNIIFIEDRSSASGPNMNPRDKKWALEQIREVHLRRYLLRRSALEIFLVDHKNFYLNFKTRDRNKVYHKIISLRPPNIVYSENGSPEEILMRSAYTRLWQTRQMSNFDYLMQLNTIAGRTYNDLTQYPVFPWVIADYTSERLDLSNPATYRDLTRPMGALNETRLKEFMKRYDNFSDPDVPKFMYGSHYSNSAIVLYYLVRMEPFTTLLLQLQSGRFDVPDRMFDSIPITFNSCLSSTADVKELIPEFFYKPEFLVNHNKFNLGVKQNGVPISDVQLPPWASTPEEFIRLNREALESDYVSERLHHWIDLVFGWKQRGRNAVEAYNVFYYLTYEGAVDIDAIEDETQRKATEAQIHNFGQTPAQLTTRPHPQRMSPSERSLFHDISLRSIKVHFAQISREPIIFIGVPFYVSPSSYSTSVPDKIITVDETRVPGIHKWIPAPLNAASSLTFEPDAILTRRRLGLAFAVDIEAKAGCFAVTNDGKMIISCGHWDNSFKCTLLESGKQTQSITRHKDIVTCLALGEDGKTLITGSKDTTLLVWELHTKGGISRVDENPSLILYGHNDEVTCVAINVELDISVSGSKDGTCIVHSLREGIYVRSIYHAQEIPICMVAISPQGYILLYTEDDLAYQLYSINGKLLKQADTHDRIHTMFVSRKGDCLLTGGWENKMIVLRRLYDLEPIYKIQTDSAIRSICMTPDERYIMVGLQDGKLLILYSTDQLLS